MIRVAADVYPSNLTQAHLLVMKLWIQFLVLLGIPFFLKHWFSTLLAISLKAPFRSNAISEITLDFFQAFIIALVRMRSACFVVFLGSPSNWVFGRRLYLLA